MKIIPGGVETKNIIAKSGREYEVVLKNAGVFTGISKRFARDSTVKAQGGNKALFKVIIKLDGNKVYKVNVHKVDFVFEYDVDFIKMIDAVIKDYEIKVYYNTYKKFLEWDGKL